MLFKVRSESFLIEAPSEVLQKIFKELSYKDKKVTYEINKLRRLKKYVPAKSAEFAQKIAELKLVETRFATEFENGHLRVPIGLLPRVFSKYDGEIEDSREPQSKINKRILRSSNKKLRKPQILALDIIRNLPDTLCFGLIEMATAVGKTRFAEELIAHFGYKTVFLVPSRNLMRTTAERFRDIFGKFEVGEYGDGKKDIRHITVATYQSVNLADPEEFKDVRLVVMDEVHHVPSNTFYNAAIVNLKHAILRFGLTATPDRADGCDLLIEAACGDTLYSYTAPEGIADGYLARPEFIMYGVQQTRGTFKKWKTEKGKRVCKSVEQSSSNSKKADTDAMVAYKHWVLGNDLLNDSVAAMARDIAAMGKCVLILVDEKEHGEKLSERLQGVAHEFVHGEHPDVEDIVGKFNRRELPILIGTTVIGEGTDTIPVDVMFNLLGNTRPKQAIGRALRNENGKKPKCLIIDFFFPNCPILDRHSSMRQEVYEEYGRVDLENLC